MLLPVVLLYVYLATSRKSLRMHYVVVGMVGRDNVLCIFGWMTLYGHLAFLINEE